MLEIWDRTGYDTFVDCLAEQTEKWLLAARLVERCLRERQKHTASSHVGGEGHHSQLHLHQEALVAANGTATTEDAAYEHFLSRLEDANATGVACDSVAGT
jgi:hypothetical protein